MLIKLNQQDYFLCPGELIYQIAKKVIIEHKNAETAMHSLKCLADSHPWLYMRIASFFKSESFTQLLVNKLPAAPPLQYTQKLCEILKIFPCQGTFNFLKNYLKPCNDDIKLHVSSLLSKAIMDSCWHNPGGNDKYLAYFLLKQGYTCNSNELYLFVKRYLHI